MEQQGQVQQRQGLEIAHIRRVQQQGGEQQQQGREQQQQGRRLTFIMGVLAVHHRGIAQLTQQLNALLAEGNESQ